MKVEKQNTANAIYPSKDKPWMKYFDASCQNLVLPEKSMFDFIYDQNKDYPNDIALEYLDIKVTYEELWANIDKVAKGLTALGVKKDEIVTIAMPNTPEFVYLAYAVNRIGAVMNLIHPLPGKEELIGYLNETESRYFFMFDGTYSIICDDLSKTKVKKAIVVSPAQSLNSIKRWLYRLSKPLKLKKNCIDWDEFLLNGRKTTPVYRERDPKAMAVMSHTGGTTGTPKGVMLSDNAENAVAFQVRNSFPSGKVRQRGVLIVLPPFVNYSFTNGIHEGLYLGSRVILIPDYKADEFHKYYKQYDFSRINDIPPYIIAMLKDKQLEKADLSKIEIIVAGGEAMDKDMEEKVNQFLADHGSAAKITKGYGATECCCSAVWTYPDVNYWNCVGIPFPMMTVKVVEPGTTDELPTMERGEICLTGPTLMLGYFHNQEATDEVIKVHPDGQRWLHMGDLGYIDNDGVVRITGRLKRIIMTKGKDGNPTKMFPERIERAIQKCNEVKLSCVIGIKDPERIRYPKAFVELKAGVEDKQLAEEHIKEVCKKNLPDYQIPEEIEFIDKLPRTSRGKIDYKALGEDSDIEE